MAKSNLAYYASIDIGKKKYISNIRYNGLFCIDNENNEITFLGRFPGYNDEHIALHSMAKQVGDKLVFFPELGKSVHTFSLIDNTFENYKIDLLQNAEIKCGCSGIVDSSEYIYMFPRYCKFPVIQISKTNLEMKVIDVLDEIYRNLSEKDILTMDFQSDGLGGYFSIYNNNLLCIVNKYGKVSIHTVDEVKNIKCVVRSNEKFWILGEKDLVEWDGQEVCRIKNVFSWMNSCPDIVKMLIINENEIAILPAKENMLILVNIKEKTVEKHIIPENMLYTVNDEIRNWRRYRTVEKQGDYLSIPPVSLENEILFDLHNRVFKSKEYIVEEGHPQFKSNQVYQEGVIYGLTDYVEYIKMSNE